ncbi:MAG TPA: hypothetical protein VGR43_02065 [Dehalococcoidia bacterium]|nr:hypothetical protein [Dehalococcoidia bacterium]
MRHALIATLLTSVAVIAGCDIVDVENIPKRWEAKLTFRNDSDSLLCFTASGLEGRVPGICNEVGPGHKTVWRPTCGYGDAAEFAYWTVVLYVRADGLEVYKRRETCRFWDEVDLEFTIEEREGKLLVEDTLGTD